jgi:hypothetical protein
MNLVKKIYKGLMLGAVSSCLMFNTSTAQLPIHKKIKVLIIGNEYVSSGLMNVQLEEIALSNGNMVETQLYATPNYSLKDQFESVGLFDEIAKGDWDYVVVQEDPSLLSKLIGDFTIDSEPYFFKIDSMIKETNRCAQTILLQPGAYKIGDLTNCVSNPDVCSFDKMNMLMQNRVSLTSKAINAIHAPVGLIYKDIMVKHPEIDLYTIDNKLPNDAAVYLTASTLYTVMFRRDPIGAMYFGSIPEPVARQIRTSVNTEVFTKLHLWNVGITDPYFIGEPTVTISEDTAKFSSSTIANNFINYHWDFGDGNTSSEADPVHIYSTPGVYTAKLYGDNCLINTEEKTLELEIKIIVGLNESAYNTEVSISPNPASAVLNIILPESVKQSDYKIYNPLGQVVKTGKINTRESIELNDLVKGFYFIQFSNSGDNFYKAYKFEKN